MWEPTYNRLIDILYGSTPVEEDLKTALAIATIAADRRSDVTSKEVVSGFEEAIEQAIMARKAGAMPPEDLKTRIRALFLND